jgi:hypothetical protein
MGGGTEDEHLNRLLDHAGAAEPPPGDALAHLLHTAATTDLACASAGEEAAAAAFRAARLAATHGSPRRHRQDHRLVLAGLAAAALAGLLITATALHPHTADTGHAQGPTHSPQPANSPGGNRPQTSAIPLDDTASINPLSPTITPTVVQSHAPASTCKNAPAAHVQTPRRQAKARRSHCVTLPCPTAWCKSPT